MSLSFLKKGDAAQTAFDQAEAKQAAGAAAAAGGNDGAFLYKHRFWMPAEAETMITFLDGDLNENGVLDEICYNEHQLQIAGDWKNFFPCVSDDEPCPLCNSGLNPSFVSVFTVIDHSEWTDKKGQVHKDQKRLYAVKRESLKLLRKMAVKRDGLRGCSFDLSRTGDRSPAVGSHYDFLKKWEDMDKFKESYNLDDVDGLDYEDTIQYKTAKELTDLGLGVASGGIGSEPSAAEGQAPDISKGL
jgi:hypothetical protein